MHAKKLAQGATVCDYAPFMNKLIQICREELDKAVSTILAAYAALKEIDARTMAILIAFLRPR
jgi:hypothetical protein